MDLSEYRRKFDQNQLPLTKADFNKNPIDQFKLWFNDVIENKIVDGNSMTLSTASSEGIVSARTVLLKYIKEDCFIFFSNYESQKGKDLKQNPYAAITFYWHELNRQVCIQGVVSKISSSESLKYFSTRPRLNKLLAWASNQDEVIESSEVIYKRLESLEQKYKESIPLPPYWGGYSLQPYQIEFWQGGEGRLNTRFAYKKTHEKWVLSQLSP